MAVSIREALDIIYQNTPVISTEILPIEACLGRIAARECIAKFDLPRFDNSAMDGYAVKCSDAGSAVICDGTLYAGDTPAMSLEKGYTIKIMTGAPIPKGCEAIVPFEKVTIQNNRVLLPALIENNAHIRHMGEDIKSGVVYLHKGEKINAYSIAMLASQGVTHLEVRRKIKVSVFGTGDELRPHFEKITPHQLYNSNTPMFLARAQELGCEVRYVGNSGDSVDSLKQVIKSAMDADIILTSGGVSMGDKDFTKEAFRDLGMKTYFEQVDIKPGKPTTYGKIAECAVVNLPGNPLASMVNFEIFVRALIAKMSGSNAHYHGTMQTRIAHDYPMKGGRHSVYLGHFDGMSFAPLSRQLPGMVSPMYKANAMMVASPSLTFLQKGSTVKIIPIGWVLNKTQQEDIFTK